jgi:ribosomal protein L22
MSPETPSDPKAEKAEAKAPAEAKAAPDAKAVPEAKATPEKKTPARKTPERKPAVAAKAEAASKKQAPASKAEAVAEREKAPARKPEAAPKAKAASKAEAGPKVKVEPEKPAPSARASAGAQAPIGQRRKVVRAQARYVRTSARKARMVCGHLRGKSVAEARAILAFTPREVARDWSKLLESAVANAENNHELIEEDLLVREAFADEGPTIKRFRPRAQGRATPIRKRTSHLTITLTPKA